MFRGAYIHAFRVKELSKNTVGSIYDSGSAEEGPVGRLG